MENPDESQAVKEYRQAYDEFFKSKQEPKDELEFRKMLRDFTHWYNNVRKQSDTGKTPSEMYKEEYGEESPEPVELSEEDILDEGIDDLKEFFEREFWPSMKKDLKEATKKEACFACFLAGVEIARRGFEEDLESAKEAISNMSPEEIEKVLRK